jgi:hypothetical protein
MEFWLSGEVDSDVSTAFRSARNDVMEAANRAIRNLDVGPVKEWAFIAIIRSVDSPLYPEVTTYRRRDSSLEFRLKIDHGDFKRADDRGASLLMMAGLLRSAEAAKTVAPSGVDLDRITQELLAVALANDWISVDLSHGPN